MKIVQINATCGVGSTGKICVGISDNLSAEGTENYIIFSSNGDGNKSGIQCSDFKYIKIQALKSRILGNYGFNSKKATRRIIGELQRIKPDIVHLHNIHGHDCDLSMLFSFFRKEGTKLVWTFHDCWAFTGYCPHFAMAKCDKWQSCCDDCVQRKEYSWFFDRSKTLFQKKKTLFSGLDLTIVTPSEWLAETVKQSFLKDYPIKVIHNGIDLDVFKPVESDFRKKYGLEDKKVVLGVSFVWNERKGIDVFIKLAQKLPPEYRIVLVGTDSSTDRILPDNIISINRTRNQKELAEIYSAADVLVNPTREEVLGLVNIEALACGTPGVTFRSGGSPECYDSSCGAVVECDDTDALQNEIIRICTEKPYNKEACVRRSEDFDQRVKLKEYLKLYDDILTENNLSKSCLRADIKNSRKEENEQ